jgi:ABC-2 type transport system permease protein
MQIKMVRSYLPSFLFFAILFPFGILISLGRIASQELTPYLISGTLTFYISVGTLTSVAQSVAAEREAGRISLIVASGVPREVYALSIVLSNGLTTLLIVPVIIVFGSLLLHTGVGSIPFLVVAVVCSVFMGSMLGMTLGFGIRNQNAVNQYSSILAFLLAFFAPVYFPPSEVPIPLRYLTFIEPTTEVSQAVYNALVSDPSSLLWSVGVVVYGFFLLFLARFLIRRQG